MWYHITTKKTEKLKDGMISTNKNKLYALKRLEPIIMLSHMRANTSLFGHILGSNPDINGYYEMHIGYFSWKSFVRQKLKYLENHKFKPGSHYIFDKVLHNEHFINCHLLKNKKTKIIISLREPEETISSIIRLFRKSKPDHEYSHFSGAVDYLTQRLNTLEHYSSLLKNHFIYLDANAIRSRTDDAFEFLQRELNLKVPLSTEYEVQSLTGIGSSGDRSSTLKAGKIINKKSDFSDIELDSDVMLQLNKHYTKVRNNIISNSKNHL